MHLIALGYTMVYGIIKLINFAHGEVFMIGSFIGYYSITVFGLGFFPALIIINDSLCIIGVIIERIAYKRLRNATRIAALDYCNWCITINRKWCHLYSRCTT